MHSNRPSSSWLARGLFWVGLVVSAALAIVVLLAPWLVDSEREPVGPQKVLAVFAQDAVVRRTSLATALALATTSFVFFRSSPSSRSSLRKTAKPPPASGGMMGA